MKIQLDILSEIISEPGVGKLKFDLSDETTANTYNIIGQNIEIREDIDENYLSYLEFKGVKQISFCCPANVLKLLRERYPDQYPPASYSNPIFKLKEKIDAYEKMNRYSKKKRSLILMEEIIKFKGDLKGSQEKIYDMYTELTPSLLAKIEKITGEEHQLQYNENENGFLFYLPRSDNSMKMNIDILALLTQIDQPLFDTNDRKEAIHLYKEKKPKLMILGGLKNSWEVKDVFLQIHEYDPFVKYVVYENSPAQSKDKELSMINEIYKGDYITDVDKYEQNLNEKREMMNNDMRNPILDRIKALQNNFSGQKYIELKYYLHHLSKKYNTTTIKTLLEKSFSHIHY